MRGAIYEEGFSYQASPEKRLRFGGRGTPTPHSLPSTPAEQGNYVLNF
jgi:hypothetical protein